MHQNRKLPRKYPTAYDPDRTSGCRKMQYFPGFLPLSDLLRSLANDELVGPLGLEPRTKGFTSAPPFPEGVDYLFTPVGCGTL
jgi:hypothetical protein